MALSSSKLLGGSLLPATGENDLPIEASVIKTTRRALPLKVRSEGQQNLRVKTFTLSRRDMMLSLSAASFSGFTLFAIEPCEARVKNPEIRRKIMEKLEMLRKKAGVLEPKTEDGDKSPPAEPLGKEKKLSPLLPPTPSPNLQKDLVGPLVEATFP